MRTLHIFGLLFCLSVSMPVAASDAENLAKQTGINLGLVSARLTEHQNSVNDMYARRIEIITSVESLAAQGRSAVDHELAVLNLTGGGNLARLLDVLRTDAAQTRKDIGAVITPLAISTDKMDGAAKNLAALAKEKSHKEWLMFLRDYFKEARDDIDKLQSDGAHAKADGDKALSEDQAKAEQSLGKAIKKQ